MRDASERFARGRRALPGKVLGALADAPVPADLSRAARTFALAQRARHRADYDMSQPFTRREVISLIRAVDDVFSFWPRIGDHRATRLFLISLLLGDRLRA